MGVQTGGITEKRGMCKIAHGVPGYRAVTDFVDQDEREEEGLCLCTGLRASKVRGGFGKGEEMLAVDGIVYRCFKCICVFVEVVQWITWSIKCITLSHILK